METNRDEIRSELLAAERAAAAPYIDYPASPAWFAPVTALWFAALVGALMWLGVNNALFAASIAVLVALEAGYLTWMRRRHGALPMPGTGTPPPEIGRVWRGYFAGCVVILGLVVLAWWQIGLPAAALTVFVLVAGGLTWYERAYVKAARTVRERLA
ncbi:MAG TPA: hypothetical protein VES02_14025 [Dermatophilaceae bacterium]|nr:hypothetical protein [Dermatophilaceae bacterium]